MIARPHPDEYAPYAATYVQRIPVGSDVLALLSRQPDDLRVLLQNVGDEQANQRPAPGEWSIKEVIGHVCDSERVFAYRALCVARGEQAPLPGFEQDDYVSATDFNARSLSDLLDEFAAQRQGNVLCFRAFREGEMVRRGTASDHPVTVRALLYIMAGHVLHHVESLQTTYQVTG